MGSGGALSLLLKPNVLEAAKAEEDLAVPGDFGVLRVFAPPPPPPPPAAAAAGLTGCLLECIVLTLVIDGTCRGPVGPAVVRAHRRHMVLRAARAANSIEGAMEYTLYGVGVVGVRVQ